MGIRQKLNNNPALSVVLAAVVIAGAMFVAFRSGCSDDTGGTVASGGAKQYFTTDDDSPGAALFIDDATKVPPFDHDGKPAYRARVYRCPHGKQFVGSLERYSESDRRRLQEAIDRNKAGKGQPPPVEGFFNAMEVKKPGDKEWVRLTAATRERYEKILRPVCPEGATDGITPVTAE